MISHFDDIMDHTRYSEPNWERKYNDLKRDFDKLKAELEALKKVTAATTDFKVGDRVKWNMRPDEFYDRGVIINISNGIALIKIVTVDGKKTELMQWISDLTLIT